MLHTLRTTAQFTQSGRYFPSYAMFPSHLHRFISPYRQSILSPCDKPGFPLRILNPATTLSPFTVKCTVAAVCTPFHTMLWTVISPLPNTRTNTLFHSHYRQACARPTTLLTSLIHPLFPVARQSPPISSPKSRSLHYPSLSPVFSHPFPPVSLTPFR